MLGTNIKIISAQKARIYNICKKVKLKLLKTNAAVWFDKICWARHLTHNNIHIKVSGNNTHSKAILYFISSIIHNFS
jgi:hypothetical protein